MPMHDWTKVPAGYFHHFHHSWIEQIHLALNRGLLPPDYYAAAEQVAGGFGPDVLTLRGFTPDPAGGVAMATATQPQRTVVAIGRNRLPRKSAVTIRHVSDDEVAAVIEVVSAGNKSGRDAWQSFVTKAQDLIEQRVHLLIVDPFPPGRRDPGGVHRAVWAAYNQSDDDPYTPPADRPLTLAAYSSGEEVTAFVEPTAVGRPLPDMPVFLEVGRWVDVPLEATYQAAWEAFPRPWKAALAADSSGDGGGRL